MLARYAHDMRIMMFHICIARLLYAKLSVRRSVRDVGDLWLHRLGYFRNNYADSLPKLHARRSLSTVGGDTVANQPPH